MIRRDRNHPSIAFWGLMNETTEGIPFSPGIEEQVGGERQEYLEDELTKKHLKDLGYM